MEQKQTNKSSLSGSDGRNAEDNLAYEDESNIPNLPGQVPKTNIVSPGDVVSTRGAGAKWKNFVTKRRATEFSFLNRTEQVTVEDNVKRIQYDKTSQESLNKALITYFTNLSKHSDSNVEVDLEFIEQLLKDGAEINCRDEFDQGILHEAAKEWHSDIMLFLLQNGADINMTDKFGRTALHVAAAVDYPEMVELLVDKGAYIEARTKDENQTPLHFAAKNDAVRSLKKLIKLGAEVEAKDYRGRTPIFVSAELDRSETARFLIDINADVTVVDTSGQICMTHMVTKMGPVARNALDQFHQKDRANRKQYFHLHLIVPRLREGGKDSLAKSPLEMIVKYRQLDLIMHPVMMRLIEIKWEQFGRRIAFRTLLINFIFVLIWTILGVGYPWQLRYAYTFPQDWWRVFFLVVGCLMTVYFVYDEINEIIFSKKKFKKWKKWREKLISKDMKFCHPQWPEEKKYLDRESDMLDDMLPYYFQDFWNYCDWVVYFSIFLVVFLHIIDASITNRVPPCCSLTAPCTNFSIEVCDTGFVNNANLSVWNNRIFVLTILFLWLRMMKYTRAFKFFGPFIVVLGKLTQDILRFLYLYLEFYIPYACAFWMIFGNVQSITTMFSVDEMLFALFRITLVDEYQFTEMQDYDVVMAYVMIGSFLAVSAVLCINLFIALLSDTFQRIYDNAKANAIMQQAALMLNFEDNLRKSKKRKFKNYIAEKCNPESLFYDDDLTLPQDADLKKVTFKIKSQMDDLLNRIQKAESKKRAEEDDDYSTPRGGKAQARSSVHDVLGVLSGTRPNVSAAQPQTGSVSNEGIQKMSVKMIELSSRMQTLQVSQTAQEESYKRLSNDIKDIKTMLSFISPIAGQEQSAEGDSAASGSKFGQTQPLALGTIVQEKSETQTSSSQGSSKSASRLFKKIIGGNKMKGAPTKASGGGTYSLFSSTTSSPPTSSALPDLDEGVEVIALPGSAASSSSQPTHDTAGSSNV